MAFDKEKTLDLAQKYIMKGQPKKAIGEYIKLIEADPKDTRLYLKLGDLYYRNGENEKAIAEYLKLAELYEEEDLNSRAISIYKKVLAINPKHIDALHKIAGLYLKEGLSGDAKNYYLSVLELKPDDPEAKKALRGSDAPPQSRDILKNISKDIPKTMPAVEFPSPAAFPSPEEIKPFDDKSDLFPSSVLEPQNLPLYSGAEVPPPDKDSEMHYHLGIAYKEMELFDYAISEFELAASNPAIKFDCCIMLGSCFLEKGDSAQAIQCFKEASQIQGLTREKLARLNFNLGLAYEASGMFSQAIDTFSQALRLDQSFSEAHERIKRLQQLQK